MDKEVYIVLTVFGSFAIVFLAWFYFKHRARLEVQHTLRLALEKGNELSPEFMKQLGEAEPSRDRDLRRGVIWLALAVGMVLCGFAIPEPEAFRGLLAGASFPFAIGIAFMIMYRYGSKKES